MVLKIHNSSRGSTGWAFFVGLINFCSVEYINADDVEAFWLFLMNKIKCGGFKVMYYFTVD